MSAWTAGGTATVNGATVDAGGSFRTAVLEAARNAGYKNFRVIHNGEEIADPSDSPETLEAGDVINVTPYDKGANS